MLRSLSLMNRQYAVVQLRNKNPSLGTLNFLNINDQQFTENTLNPVGASDWKKNPCFRQTLARN